jgi:hypothetical protein
MSYIVKNVNGSSKRATLPTGYSSWIDFWEKKSGKIARTCKRIFCEEPATDGTHVQVEGHGNYWYIVPLCHADNMSSSDVSFTIEGPLVPVNDTLEILP